MNGRVVAVAFYACLGCSPDVFVMRDTWKGERMPLHQRRQALWSAYRWLQARAFKQEPIEARAIDRGEMAKHLRSYREKADA